MHPILLTQQDSLRRSGATPTHARMASSQMTPARPMITTAELMPNKQHVLYTMRPNTPNPGIGQDRPDAAEAHREGRRRQYSCSVVASATNSKAGLITKDCPVVRPW